MIVVIVFLIVFLNTCKAHLIIFIIFVPLNIAFKFSLLHILIVFLTTCKAVIVVIVFLIDFLNTCKAHLIILCKMRYISY